MSKILINLSQIRIEKKRELNKRKQRILDSLEKIIEKITLIDLDNQQVIILEQLIKPCEEVYQKLIKVK